MKKFVFILITAVLLSGCGVHHLPVAPSVTQQVTAPMDAGFGVTEPVTEPIVTESVITQPEHSDLYLPDLSVDDVIGYYNEVVLDAEFVNDGNPSKVQKWVVPVVYILYGEPTHEDRDVIASFTQWLNSLSGFPGIRETTVDAEANLHIYFCSAEEMIHILGDNFYGMDGGVTYWYENDRIYNENICIRTDLPQELRNSVILEEIYNGLGPVQDTDLREDSIAFSGFSKPQSLTAVDELILKLLYHPEIRCGMDAEQCENVIRQLYY